MAKIGRDAVKLLEKMGHRVFVFVAKEEQVEIWTSQHKSG